MGGVRGGHAKEQELAAARGQVGLNLRLYFGSCIYHQCIFGENLSLEASAYSYRPLKCELPLKRRPLIYECGDVLIVFWLQSP